MTENDGKQGKTWKELPPEQIAALMNRKSEGYLTGLLGFTLVSVSKERVLARMEIEKHHLAPNGYLHAASVVALADSTCGFAVSMHLPEGAGGFTTMELKTIFSALPATALSCAKERPPTSAVGLRFGTHVSGMVYQARTLRYSDARK